jgi:amino acid adenylation domain-containing protein
MVPAAFTVLDALPLSPNGKVDRRALPAPGPDRPGQHDMYVAPRAPIEELLSAIWCEVLHLERISIHDNFFELGGHSLLAVRTISRMCSALGVQMSLQDLFGHPTIAALAAHVAQAMPGEAVPAIARRAGGGPWPLSFAQERLLFLDRLLPNRAVYNSPFAVEWKGALDVESLQRALNTIIARHEPLRTTFQAGEECDVQVIAAEATVKIQAISLRHLSAGDREGETRRVLEEEARRPFDLGKDVMLRALVVELSDQEHILLLTFHHIAVDGWSLDVFFRELGEIYGAYVNRQSDPELPELPICYRDYALWQREWLQGEVLQRELSYWKKQLQGVEALQLPTDRPRPVEPSYQGGWERAVLPQDLSERLRVFRRQEGVSLFILLLAGFQTLLYRYSGQDDICVGSPVANRTRSETEHLIGFFLNTLVMRTDFRGEPRLRDLLKRVKGMVWEALAHQELPFERLVQELQPERSGSHSALFQVMFVLNNTLERGLILPEIAAIREVGTGTAKFDLTLFVEDRAGGIETTLEYSTDLFDRATARRMLGHYRTLLEAVVADPDQQVSHMPILDEAERRQVLVEWNDTKREYPQLCVHQLFEEQVERTPDAVALVCGEEQWTYQALNASANQLAHYLQKQGIGPEVLVGVCCTRSRELMVSILGVLKAGGAYVPLDPGYPTERLAFMLADAQVKLLLTQHQLAAQLPPGQSCLYLDRDWDQLAGESVTNPASAVQLDHLAYVLYTSGSTGKPKGTQILHRGLTNYLGWAVQTYAVGKGDGAPVHSSISFDATITSLFTPLLAGKRVVLVPEQNEIEALSALLQSDADFSLVKITPAHLEVLSHLLPESAAALGARAFIIGGEALFGKQLAFWQAHAPHTRMINEYGPTETVVGCCVYEVTPDHAYAGAVPIGRPIANTQLYVLDQHLQPKPLGVPGELYIGGAGVARGYHNRPELSAEKFLPNPFGPGRMYRTGDLVRYLPDGNLVYLGRLDDQVKLRGFRVELGEIEAALTEHPGVREAAVVLDDRDGDKWLVGYFVSGQSTPSTAELRTYLGGKMPDYMLPSVFVVLEAMPLTPNGKVDRRALPAPGPDRLGQHDTYVAPRTPIEELLSLIWCEVLHLDRIGIHDNFFDLGGHSLVATRVRARIAAAFDLEISLARVFQTPTVEGLAEAVAEAGRARAQDMERIVAELEAQL